MDTPHMPLNGFSPFPGLSNGHAQTLAGTSWPRRVVLPPAERLVVDVAPGRRVLALWNGHAQAEGRPAVLLLHGLEGHVDTGFVRGMAARALELGMGVVRMNMRSCGGTEKLSGGGYNNGQHADIQHVVDAVMERFKPSRLALCGYSMGGNMLLQLAASWGEAPPEHVKGVAVVCPAVDLLASSRALHRPINRGYEAFFLSGLLSRSRRLARLDPSQHVPLRRFPRSLFEFDDVVTAPLGGFNGALDYYARCSAAPRVGDIRVPTLWLHARDDPFVPLTELPRALAAGNAFIRLVETTHGGHCGFVGAGAERFYAEAACVAFAAAVMGG